jgi:sodium transport system permease protein
VSVLYRVSERLDLGRWVLHLVRDRRDTPSVAEALACVVLIFVLQFFVNFAMARAGVNTYNDVLVSVFTSQVVVILLPGLMMTLLLTRRPLATLLVDHLPRPSSAGIALLLAVVFHPVGQQLAIWIHQLYPPSEELAKHAQEFMRMLLLDAPYAWIPFVLIAVLPALCEELTFRGFVLSGLRHLGHKWWAIVLSAIFFGMAHSLLQQSLAAMAVGLVIGYIAVQTGSLVPGVLFHCTYNSLTLLSARLAMLPAGAEAFDQMPTLRLLYDRASALEGVYVYNWGIVALGAVLSLSLLLWLYRLPYQATEEERLEEVRERNAHSLVSET